MAAKRKTISQWIQEAISDPDKTEKLTRLTLIHKVGVGNDEVHTTRLDNGRQYTADDLGNMLDGKARVFCQDMQGVQTFQLCAFYGAANEPEGKYTFLINVTSDMFAADTAVKGIDAAGKSVSLEWSKAKPYVIGGGVLIGLIAAVKLLK